MIKALFAFFSLAVALTLLVLISGYLDYRREINNCLESGGIVIKTARGLKCVPVGKINHI